MLNSNLVVPLPRTGDWTGCVPMNVVNYTWTYFLPMLLFELTLFSLAVVKSIDVYRIRRDAGQTPNILAILIRDSAFYFASSIVIIMTNLLIWAIGRVRSYICCHL